MDIAADGPGGLWLATEKAYGAIVLDVMLPGLDGFQLCRRLRESGAVYPGRARRPGRHDERPARPAAAGAGQPARLRRRCRPRAAPPLAVLQGELELAARPGRGHRELTAAVRNAEAEAERLARLTDDLLLLVRSDEDRLSLRLERTDIGSLLRRSAELASSRLAAADVTGVDVRPGTYAHVDADRTRQAVDNLVGQCPAVAARRNAASHRGPANRAACRRALAHDDRSRGDLRRRQRGDHGGDRGERSGRGVAGRGGPAGPVDRPRQPGPLPRRPAGAGRPVPVPPGSHVYPATRPSGGGR